MLSSIIVSEMPTLRKIHTTRPGWACSRREKKFDHDSEPE